MPTNDAKETAVACLQAWSSGDFERTRALLREDVTFTGPLGATQGAGAYVAGVARLAQIVRGVRIHEAVAEGAQVALCYDLVTTAAGAVPTVGWYEIHDGKVASVRAFFDPRPLT